MTSRSRRMLFSRGVHLSPPSPNRGRRECRAADAPAVSCARSSRKRTRAYRSHRNHPAFPTQWFTAYIVLSSANGLSCHRRPQEAFASQKLDTSVGVSGPHDFTVRNKALSSRAPPAATASCPALVTLANAPPMGQDGCEYRGDLGIRKNRIISKALRQNDPSGKTPGTSPKNQNKNGLTETDILPSAACSTLNSTCFCATVSPTFTYNSPVQAAARAVLEFMTTVSSRE